MAVVIIGIILFFVISVFLNLGKDKESLQGKTITEKFSIIINRINEVGFRGEANIHRYSDTHISMVHRNGGNQFADIMYSQGTLMIEWRYKYLQKEMKFKKTFINVRNMSLIEQNNLADGLIAEMNDAVIRHQQQVMNLNI